MLHPYACTSQKWRSTCEAKEYMSKQRKFTAVCHRKPTQHVQLAQESVKRLGTCQMQWDGQTQSIFKLAHNKTFTGLTPTHATLSTLDRARCSTSTSGWFSTSCCAQLAAISTHVLPHQKPLPLLSSGSISPETLKQTMYLIELGSTVLCKTAGYDKLLAAANSDTRQKQMQTASCACQQRG